MEESPFTKIHNSIFDLEINKLRDYVRNIEVR